MSSQLAISAITAALAQVIQAGLTDRVDHATVTTLPPGQAQDQGVNHVNLFLYRVTTDAAFANSDWPPTRTRAGERGRAPLALSLHYLLTPFGKGSIPAQPADDMLLGYAMTALHDHPFLGLSEIRAAAALRQVIPDAATDLPWQTEGVRVSFDPLTLDELTKLWTTFQAPYRVSSGYQACVALIDSNLAGSVPLPVLRRGFDDRGPVAEATLALFPTLKTIWLQMPVPGGPPGTSETLISSVSSYSSTGPAATTGSTLAIRGQSLEAVVEVVLVAARTGTGPPPGVAGGAIAATITPHSLDPGQVLITLPDDLPAAGRYMIAARVDASSADDPGQTRRTLSNSLPLLIGPSVTFQATTVALVAGAATIVADVKPPVIAGQDPALLLGAQRFAADTFPLPGSQLQFTIHGLAAGTYTARLRVDGVDAEAQVVTLT